jgi:hypothetical protein
LFDVSRAPPAVAGITHLGYPAYLVRYLGVLKLLAVAALFVRGRPRLTEWAYAGLFFDTSGALYSAAAVGDPVATWLPAAAGVALTLGSYALYHAGGRDR